MQIIPDHLLRSPIASGSPVRFGNGVIVTDLTLLPRAGAKGPALRDFLDGGGFRLGTAVNRAYRQDGGALLALLSPTEVLWLGPCDGAGILPWQSEDAAPLAPAVYAVPRRGGTFWFHIEGTAARDGFSRLCGIDFRDGAFPDLHVAQTLAARVSVVIIREDQSGSAAYHLIGDISLAAYMWEALATAMSLAVPG
jgi:sarcosine oxidase gamma subunit